MRFRHARGAFRALAGGRPEAYLANRSLNPRLGDRTMANIIEKIRRWRDENVSRGQLARLDARMLNDLGLVRGDIARVVRHTN
jgi:uncharacterized protein YjiS (DUF1127 family)